MNWTDKYNDFRAECIIALKEALKKGYNQKELWNNKENDERYSLPIEIYCDDGFYEYYTIVKWDSEEECFTGIGWESEEDFHFWIDNLETRTICNLIDLINETV